MKLYALGASHEVGRSAFLLETDKRVMLDYGIKIFTHEHMPEYPKDIDRDIRLDAGIISHAHLDHSGYVPYFYQYSNIPWFASKGTYEIADILWQDSMKITPNLPWDIKDYKKALRNWHMVEEKKPIFLGKTKFNFFDAGHILGSLIIKAEYNKKSIVYTGDFKMAPTRMHSGAKSVEADILITESTYSDREHPVREELEKVLINEITATLEEGGNVLFPAFAVGRSQELISIIRNYLKDVPIYLDGMSKAITDIYYRNSEKLKNGKEFRKFVDTINFVEGVYDKKNALKEPSVVISTAGMLEGGPALNYIKRLNANSKIILTGYAIEGTNAWLLREKNQLKIENSILDVSLPVEYLDFSAHAGMGDLKRFIKESNPELVICVHGDKTEEFARNIEEEFGIKAIAPNIGDIIDLEQ